MSRQAEAQTAPSTGTSVGAACFLPRLIGNPITATATDVERSITPRPRRHQAGGANPTTGRMLAHHTAAALVRSEDASPVTPRGARRPGKLPGQVPPVCILDHRIALPSRQPALTLCRDPLPVLRWHQAPQVAHVRRRDDDVLPQSR